MLPTDDLFVYVSVLVDDAISAGAIAIAARPGPAPACSDAELLAIAVVRHLLGRRSEAGFLAEVARDWAYLFPRLPHQSQANRRIRWLWGAFEQLRVMLAARLPEDDCQQIDTSALPDKHTSRVRGPDQWTGPVNDRGIAVDLLEAGPVPRHLLADKGFNGKAFAAQLAARGTAVLVPPTKDQRQQMPSILQKVIAEWRNRIEASFGEITDRMELARHGAHTFWGLLARTAATIAAHALQLVLLADLGRA